MAETNKNAPEEQSLEKAIWGTVGTGVLWLALILSGLAVERLGISSNILSGILPGEVGSLREQIESCNRDLGAVKLERDNLNQTEGALRVEISKLKRQLEDATKAAAAPAATTPAP
ncbi:MAG: hypothetical protein AB7G75_06760 [Candidatus Binatia bacterium]